MHFMYLYDNVSLNRCLCQCLDQPSLMILLLCPQNLIYGAMVDQMIQYYRHDTFYRSSIDVKLPGMETLNSYLQDHSASCYARSLQEQASKDPSIRDIHFLIHAKWNNISNIVIVGIKRIQRS